MFMNIYFLFFSSVVQCWMCLRSGNLIESRHLARIFHVFDL